MSRINQDSYDRLLRQGSVLQERMQAWVEEGQRLQGDLADFLSGASGELWFALIRPADSDSFAQHGAAGICTKTPDFAEIAPTIS